MIKLIAICLEFCAESRLNNININYNFQAFIYFIQFDSFSSMKENKFLCSTNKYSSLIVQYFWNHRQLWSVLHNFPEGHLLGHIVLCHHKLPRREEPCMVRHISFLCTANQTLLLLMYDMELDTEGDHILEFRMEGDLAKFLALSFYMELDMEGDHILEFRMEGDLAKFLALLFYMELDMEGDHILEFRMEGDLAKFLALLFYMELDMEGDHILEFRMDFGT